jgi:hypothetical protein
VDEVPPPRRSPPAITVWAGVLLVLWRGQVLLLPPAAGPVSCAAAGRQTVRSDFSRLHRGMWGVPQTSWFAGGAEPPGAARQWGNWLRACSLPVSSVGRVTLRGHFAHAITKYRLRVAVWGVELDGRHEMPSGMTAVSDHADVAGARFFRLSGSPLPVSRMTEKALHFHNDTVV